MVGKMVALRWWFAALTALMLSACGGGGGGGGPNSPDFAGDLISIALSPNNGNGSTPINVATGQTQQFVATGTFRTPPGASTPTEDRVIGNVTWSSSVTSVASINGDGLLTALAPGQTQIGASRGDVASAPVIVSVVNVLPDQPGALLRIDIAPQVSVVSVGQTALLTATGRFQDGDRPISVSWSSASPAIASVSPATGTTTTVTGVAVGGPIVITAAAVDRGNTFTATASVTVVQNQGQNILVDLVITPSDPSVPVTQTVGFTATGRCSNGVTISDCPAQGVTWTSEDTNVATVSPAAGPTTIATALRAGTTRIRASAPNSLGGAPITAFTTLTVQGEPALNRIEITPSSANVPLGQPVNFTVRAFFEDDPLVARPIAASRVTFSSSNTTVATVSPVNSNQTTATTRDVGSTSIIARVLSSSGAEVSDTAILTVRQPELQAITVFPRTATIPAGTTQTFVARGRFSNTPDAVTDDNLPLVPDVTVTFSSGNNQVAAITRMSGATAVVTGVRADPTAVAITATAVNQSGETLTGSALLTVVAAELQALLRIEPVNANVIIGSTQQFRLIGRFTNSPPEGSAISPVDQNGQQQVRFTSNAPAIATVTDSGLATGVSKGQAMITGMLVDGTFPSVTPRSQTATLNVTDSICVTPVRSNPPNFFPNAREIISGLCLLCTVANPLNAIDANPQTLTRIDVPVGLLLANAALRVELVRLPLFAPPVRTNPLIERGPGFLIAQPPGLLIEAELVSQIVLRTLTNGVQMQSSQEQGNVLRLDLLGTTLLGDRELGFVSFPATIPFNELELTLNSGVATALNTVFVADACLETRLPGVIVPPPAPLLPIP